MTLRVAVTGITGDVGRGAVQGLRQHAPDAEPVWIVGFDASSNPPIASRVDAFVQLPLVRSANYIEALAAALGAHHVEVLLPGIDSEIPVISAARARLAATGTKVVLSPEELVQAADDKLATAAFLSARGIGTPKTSDATAVAPIAFPMIAKPRRGHASQGISLLSDAAGLHAFLATQPRNYCFQEYIDGPELTIGLLYDAQGVLRDALAMERSLAHGRTVEAKVVNDPAIAAFIADFGAKVRGIGPVNVQLRVDRQRGPLVFEINARLSGSTDIRVQLGFNDPLRLARHFGRGEAIVPAQPQKAIVFRSGSVLTVRPC